jgi:hypothetical protein
VGTVVEGGWATEDCAVVGTEIVEISAAGAPSNGPSAVHTVTVDATDGTMIVDFDGARTAALAHDVSTANMQAAARALATVGGAHVTVTGSAGTSYVFTFSGNLGKLAVPLITVDAAKLVKNAGAGTATVVETTPGVTATGRNKAPGAHYTNLTTGDEYVNTGTGLAPSWTAIGTAIGGEITALAAAIPTAAVADLGALTAAAVTGTIPAGGTGAAAGGWDTSGNRDTAIATIGELKTKLNAAIVDLASERTKLNDLLAKLRTAGIITP